MSPRGSARAWLTLLFAMLLPGLAQASDRSPTARLWLEAGPSIDRTTNALNPKTGYGLGGGVEFGRSVGLLMSFGFEHYPGSRTPFLIQGYSTASGTMRWEGGGDKTVLAGSVGVRAGIPIEPIEPFVEVAVGIVSVVSRRGRLVDPAAPGTPTPGYGWGGDALPLGELGAGLRTRRPSGFDWTLAVRLRGYSPLFEGSGEGSSIQVGLGVVTP